MTMLQVNLNESSLSEIVDRVHQLFEQWERSDTLLPRVNEETLVCTRIVLHEWVANLIQHGDFDERLPIVTISLRFENGRAECFVRDNSNGFDIQPYLGRKLEQCIHTLPDRGMGLSMLQGCTEALSYDRTGSSEYQLNFSVSAERGQFRTTYAMAS